MDWSILVRDADPWVMYRVFVSGLAHMYVRDVWKIMTVSYVSSSVMLILSFVWVWNPVHHMFTYPVGVLVGVFASSALQQKPSNHAALHMLSVLPWTGCGLYGALGYPMFILPYLVTLLIAKMYKWAVFSAVCMTLNALLIPLHSPLVSLCLPVASVLVFIFLGYTPFDHV